MLLETTGSSEATQKQSLILEMTAEEQEMLGKISLFPVLKNFAPDEERILRATQDKRVWLIAAFFDQHISDARGQLQGSQKSYGSVCESRDEGHFSDPSQLEGGAITEAVDRQVRLLDRSNHWVKHLAAGKQRFMQQLSEYGFCQECGEPIFLKRLELVPHSSLCVPCKEESKKRG